MIKSLFAASLALAAAGSVSGATVSATTDVGSYMMGLNGAPVTPATNFVDRATLLAYADWSAPQGAGVLNGVLTTGLNRLDGDHIQMLPNGVNLLNDMGFSFGNNNVTGSTARVTGFAYTLNFFDGVSLANVGGFNGTSNLTGLSGGGLAAQSSVRLSFGAGVLEPLNILLPTDVIVTVTVTSVTFNAGTGIDATLIGQQIRNPVSVGTSTDELILNGAVTADPFGTGPDGNFSYFIVTNSVPTPGAMGLLGLGGLVALRRRR